MTVTDAPGSIQIGRSKSVDYLSEQDQLLGDKFSDDGREDMESATSPLRGGESISLTRFVYFAFFLTCGGPYGLEAAVSAGGACVTLIGLLVLPLVWTIPQALMTAELATMMPENGGSVVWVYRGLGQTFGALNAINTFVAGLIDKCIYPNIFMAYWPGASESRWAMLLGRPLVLVGLTALNAAGIKAVADSLALMLLGTMAVFVLEIPYAIKQFHLSDFTKIPEQIDWGVMMSVLLWACTGWDSVGSIAGEVADPGRTLPLGLGLAIIMSTLAYVIPVVVGYALMPDPRLWSTGDGFVAAARRASPWLGAMTIISGLLSSLGLCNAGIASTGQMLCAMGRQTRGRRRVVPAWFGSRSKDGVPLRSFWSQCIVMCLLVQTDLAQLIQLEMVFACIALLLEFATFIMLRQNESDAIRPFQVPGGWTGVWAITVPKVIVVMITLLALLISNPVAFTAAVTINLIAFVVFHYILSPI